jgi:hypothetical protein
VPVGKIWSWIQEAPEVICEIRFQCTAETLWLIGPCIFAWVHMLIHQILLLLQIPFLTPYGDNICHYLDDITYRIGKHNGNWKYHRWWIWSFADGELYYVVHSIIGLAGCATHCHRQKKHPYSPFLCSPPNLFPIIWLINSGLMLHKCSPCFGCPLNRDVVVQHFHHIIKIRPHLRERAPKYLSLGFGFFLPII